MNNSNLNNSKTSRSINKVFIKMRVKEKVKKTKLYSDRKFLCALKYLDYICKFNL